MSDLAATRCGELPLEQHAPTQVAAFRTRFGIPQSGTGRGGKGPEAVFEQPEYQFLLRRNDEILMELGRCREKAEKLDRSILKLRQELEEKNMLIALLMKKGGKG